MLRAFPLAVVLVLVAREAVGAGPFGGPVLGKTERNSVSSTTAFPENQHRDLALQDDGSLWVADPTSRFITVFGPQLGSRSTLTLDETILLAEPDSPLGGVVGICAVPGHAGRANHILVRHPEPVIALVEPRESLLKVIVDFRHVQQLPPGTFLTGLDRHPTSPELLTMDEAGRQAFLLNADYRVIRQVKLLGEGNPLSGAGVAYVGADAFLAGASFGRPFSLNLALEHHRSNGFYASSAYSLDAVEGAIAGGFDLGEFAGQPAIYFYNMPEDRIVAVAARRAPAPPPAEVTVAAIGGGEDRQLRFKVDPNYGIDEVVVRENGVTIGSVSPAGAFNLYGRVGTSALEIETRAGGVPNPISLSLHLFNGAWIGGEAAEQRFRSIPFNPDSPDFDPGDFLSGLALDWQGSRDASRLYVATRQSRVIRSFTGDGEPSGSFAHQYPGRGVTGLALAPGGDGEPRLMLLDSDGIPPPQGDGQVHWAMIDLRGNLLAQGPLDTSLLGPRAPVDLGDWDDDGRGGYIAYDRASKKICAIDGARMAIAAAAPAPTWFLEDRGTLPPTGGAAAVLPSGLILLSGSGASPLASEAYLLTGLGSPGGGLFTGYSLAVPDLAAFRVLFCDGPTSGIGCPRSMVSLPGVGFRAIEGLESAYEEATGHEIAYFITPNAVLFRYWDGGTEREATVLTQGLLARTGAHSRPDRAGAQLFDAVLSIPPAPGAGSTPSLRAPFAVDGEVSFFVHVLNPSGSETLLVEARLILNGVVERPVLSEKVSLPPRLHWRRTVTVPGSSALSLVLVDHSGRAQSARVLVGAIGKRPEAPRFRRGDADSTGRIDITDAVAILNHLFLAGPAPPCPDAADADDGGALDVTDPILLLQYLILGGPPPAAPGPEACGSDTSADALEVCLYGACV